MAVDPGAAETPAMISITWTFTDTYRQRVPLAAVADAAGHSVAVVAADPSVLHGRVGDRLADLLTGYQNDQNTVEVPEVEILATDLAAQPSLAQLVDQASRVVAGEPHASTLAGRALAALLAGLRREQLVD